MFGKKERDAQPLPAKGLRVTIETADPEYLAAGLQRRYTMEGEGVIAFVNDTDTTHTANIGRTSAVDAIAALVRKGLVNPMELLSALMLGGGMIERDAEEQERADEERAREGGEAG